jgi:bifunctional DNase/RNase
MDKKIKIYSTELRKHAIAKMDTIRLKDENGTLVLVVPVESFAMAPIYQSVFKSDEFPEAAHRVVFNMIRNLGGKILSITIDDLQDWRLFATIQYVNSDGEEFTVTAEAGDALALAFLTHDATLYVKESLINIEKTNRLNRVYWYQEDEKLVNEARELSLEELVKLPSQDVKQLLEIVAANEDFEFAVRLKNAGEIQEENIKQMTEMITKMIGDDPNKFYNDMVEKMKKNMSHVILKRYDVDENDDDDDK